MLLEVLRVHPRKRTATAQVRRADGSLAVLKHLLADAPRESALGLHAERDFYASGAFGLTARFLTGGDDWYLRAYEDGIPLRRLVVERPAESAARLPELITTTIAALAATRQRAETGREAEHAGVAAGRRVRNLLTSGPSGTRRGAWAQRLASSVAAGAQPAVARLVVAQCARFQRGGARWVSDFTHGDLHADNVLVTARGPRVLDFENISRPGLWWLDGLYLTATCHAALRDPEQRVALQSAVLRLVDELEPSMVQGVAALAELFASAAVSNERFRCARVADRADLDQWVRSPRALARMLTGRGVS
jgi:aminoglycoside phosphotransferase (APT) family kinase protein